jgi:hypothetical protein
MKMMSITNKPAIYWGVQAALIGPLIILWCGVAYWFGFASEILMRTVFPRRLAPLLLLTALGGALVWTGLHLKSTPAEERRARTVDIWIIVFILFSIFLLAGQIKGV